jgi:S-DNA-T family DNA segregation ATPase FtsK/SpoIIIE
LLADVVQSASYEKFVGGIPLILGQDTVGNNVVVDLAKMPHLLVAGSTGSGKSVALNAMLISILCARTPDEVRLILIDPKRLEFVPYADIAHLLFPIITESKDAVSALGWVVHEMDVRYKRMAEKGARNCADYNKIVTRAEQIPFIVVIIDELSDLMMTAGREIEGLIIRITQMARAAGIHMIVATQRPSVDVITGLIKVNFPSRISFRVTSKIDSRTILDCGGADKLLGRGDMLFLDSTDSTLKRVHGAYVTDDEIKKVADAIRQQQSPLYLDLEPHIANVGGDLGQEDEALYSEILKFLKEIDEISISLLQRKFRIGYNRSARIIEILEARGLVASSESGKTRKVIR